jgi:nucleotide-binding universal stress UspA family protein
VPSIIELEERRIAEDLVKVESVFRAIVGSRSRVEWRQSVAFPTPFVLEQACAADLIVVARPQRDRRASGPPSIDGGYLVMDAGRPVLFVPPQVEYLSAKRIVIGWKDVREARRAVHDGLPLLTRAEEVLIVSSGGDSRGARDVGAYLGCHGIDAHILAPPVSPVGSTADELVRIAQGEGADLIVSGAYGHNRAREWVFGGVTHDLLHHSPLCCLMSH